jgi:hypothetical protein
MFSAQHGHWQFSNYCALRQYLRRFFVHSTHKKEAAQKGPLFMRLDLDICRPLLALECHFAHGLLSYTLKTQNLEAKTKKGYPNFSNSLFFYCNDYF